MQETELARLWMLTSTASELFLEGLNAKLAFKGWSEGIYFLGESLASVFVVIHRLPLIQGWGWFGSVR